MDVISSSNACIDQIVQLELHQWLEITSFPGRSKTDLCLGYSRNALNNGHVVYLDAEGCVNDDITRHERFLYYRITSSSQLLAVIWQLQSLINEYALIEAPIKLIVIDSIAFHLRHYDTKSASKMQMLATIGSILNQILSSPVAVITTNHYTTVIENDESHLSPSLGNVFSKYPFVRLKIFWKNGLVYANCNETDHPISL
jgi:RecA/RadA recombinase